MCLVREDPTKSHLKVDVSADKVKDLKARFPWIFTLVTLYPFLDKISLFMVVITAAKSLQFARQNDVACVSELAYIEIASTIWNSFNSNFC